MKSWSRMGKRIKLRTESQNRFQSDSFREKFFLVPKLRRHQSLDFESSCDRNMNDWVILRSKLFHKGYLGWFWLKYGEIVLVMLTHDTALKTSSVNSFPFNEIMECWYHHISFWWPDVYKKDTKDIKVFKIKLHYYWLVAQLSVKRLND